MAQETLLYFIEIEEFVMDLTSTMVAYVGAASWLPQLFKWLYKLYSKPVISIFPQKIVEIGFTSLGPILNLQLAMDTDKKDILIKKVGFRLTHEDGSNHDFEWVSMRERFSEIVTAHGNQYVEREYGAISIKLNKNFIIERYFRFQNSKFISNHKLFTEKLAKKRNI